MVKYFCFALLWFTVARSILIWMCLLETNRRLLMNGRDIAVTGAKECCTAPLNVLPVSRRLSQYARCTVHGARGALTASCAQRGGGATRFALPNHGIGGIASTYAGKADALQDFQRAQHRLTSTTARIALLSFQFSVFFFSFQFSFFSFSVFFFFFFSFLFQFLSFQLDSAAVAVGSWLLAFRFG